MQKWKCTNCGYEAEGSAPPEKCPNCGAPRDKFVPESQSPEVGEGVC